MTTTKNTTFYLVAIGLGQNKIVKEGSIGLIQSEKTKLQKEQAWKNYYFQIRTPEGYKAIKVLTKKGQKK